MEISKISTKDLQGLLKNEADLLLLDVLPPEYYAQKHIKGAENAPVYEVQFLEYVQGLVKGKNQRIVLYSKQAQSLAPQDALEKLLIAGCKNVQILEGGMDKWEADGYAVQEGQKHEFAEIREGEHEIDTEASIFSWIGRNAKYAHRGKIKIKSGSVYWENGEIASGEIILDMTSIQDEDIADENMRKVLEAHLKSSDFFDVVKYPGAKFTFNDVAVERNPIGQNNSVLFGLLTIKDMTREIEIPAMIVAMPDGTINGQAHFDIDRTLWNVRYGSEKFFEKLGMHLVNDVISLEMFLVAKA